MRSSLNRKKVSFAETPTYFPNTPNTPNTPSALKQLNLKQMSVLIAAATGRDPSHELYAYETNKNPDQVAVDNKGQIEKDFSRIKFILTTDEIPDGLGGQLSKKFIDEFSSRNGKCRLYSQGDFTARHSAYKNSFSYDKPQLDFRFENANHDFAVIVDMYQEGIPQSSGFAKVILKKQSVFVFNHNGKNSYFLPYGELQRLIATAEEKFEDFPRPMTEGQSKALDGITQFKKELVSIPNADLSSYLDTAITDDNLKQIFKNSIMPSGEVSLVPLRFIPAKALSIDKKTKDYSNTFSSIDDTLKFSNYFVNLKLSSKKERFFNAFSYFLCENTKIRNKLDVNAAKSLFDNLGALYESLKKKKNGTELLKNIESAFYEYDPGSALLMVLKEYRSEFFVFLDILKASLPEDQFNTLIKNTSPELAIFLPLIQDINKKNNDVIIVYGLCGLIKIIMSEESYKLRGLVDHVYDQFVNPLVVAKKYNGASKEDDFSKRAVTSLLQVLDDRIEIDSKVNNFNSLKLKIDFIKKIKENIKKYPNLIYLCDIVLQEKKILDKQKLIINDLFKELQNSPYLYPKWHDPRPELHSNTRLHYIKSILELVAIHPVALDENMKKSLLEKAEVVFFEYHFDNEETKKEIASLQIMLNNLMEGQAVDLSLPIFECLNDPDKQKKPEKPEKPAPAPASFFVSVMMLFLEKMKQAFNGNKCPKNTLKKPSVSAAAKNWFSLFACLNSRSDSELNVDAGFESGRLNDLNTR